jgi:hypothetical protein
MVLKAAHLLGFAFTQMWKLFHDCTISLSGEVWTHKTRSTPPLFTEVSVPSQENERSYIYVLNRYDVFHFICKQLKKQYT